jgi:apolipoprotein N-acyltransferase
LYYLRDFGLGSVNLFAGVALLGFGAAIGTFAWVRSAQEGVPATAGTVMIAVLPLMLGFQLLLSFVSFDVANEPTIPLQAIEPSVPGKALTGASSFNSNGVVSDSDEPQAGASLAKPPHIA